MNISILGSGVVGQGIGKALVENNIVIFYDINKDTVDSLISDGFGATVDLNYAIQNSEISFISVPTPSTEKGIDLSILDSITRECAEVIKDKDYHIFVIKSTVVPGTTENLVIPNLEISGKKADVDFGVVYNPEFLTEISHTWTNDKEFTRDLDHADKIVIGESEDKKAGSKVLKLYGYMSKVTPVVRTNYKTAEIIKYANNIRLATAIAFSNEMFQICKELGIDGEEVARIVAMDKRIGKYGSVCGKAFGGKCFPKDLRAFIKFVRANTNRVPILMEAVEEINNDMNKDYGVRE